MKFKERFKIVYIKDDGELNWYTIIVDSIVAVATIAIIVYIIGIL